MNDLTPDLNNVWLALMNIAKNSGASIMFIGVRAQTGVSFCAREFAQLSQSRATKAVWLLDLDFFANGQLEKFKKDGAKFTGPFDMCFGVRPFWRLNPANHEADIKGAIVGMRIDDSKLFVSRFRRDRLKSGQNIQIGPAAKYWQNLKKHIEITIIDAPPTEASRAGIAIASDVDAIVIVVDSESDFEETAALRDELISRGGNLIGLVVIEEAKSQKKNFARA